MILIDPKQADFRKKVKEWLSENCKITDDLQLHYELVTNKYLADWFRTADRGYALSENMANVIAFAISTIAEQSKEATNESLDDLEDEEVTDYFNWLKRKGYIDRTDFF